MTEESQQLLKTMVRETKLYVLTKVYQEILKEKNDWQKRYDLIPNEYHKTYVEALEWVLEVLKSQNIEIYDEWKQ